jgi:hypothetical protein
MCGAGAVERRMGFALADEVRRVAFGAHAAGCGQ